MIKIIGDQITIDKNKELNYYGRCLHCKKKGYKDFIGFAPCFAGNIIPDNVSIYKCPDCSGIFAFLENSIENTDE